MPRARRPALPSAEMSLRGKGAAACLCRPRPFQVGVFFCVLLPVPCGIALLPPMWGKRRGGGSKPWFLPQRCLPLSSIPSPKRRATCAGVARQCAGAPVHAGAVARVTSRSWVYGPRDLPVRLSVGHTSPQCGVCRWCFPYVPLLCGCSVRCNAWPDYPPAAADQPATMWQCAHARQALRSISRQEGGEEHDFCDCGTLH
jgi:hypothetical protein